jgi:hypothetical protein
MMYLTCPSAKAYDGRFESAEENGSASGTAGTLLLFSAKGDESTSLDADGDIGDGLLNIGCPNEFCTTFTRSANNGVNNKSFMDIINNSI